MKVARSKKGMVVAAHPLAAEAGREILAEGGNAVEAAVATSLALGVVEPYASSLGGGGFLMIAPAGDPARTEILDGRARISSLATEERAYPKGVTIPWTPKIGPLSAAVPGLAPMLEMALKRHGQGKPLKRLAKRAIEYAEKGFKVDEVYCYCVALFEAAVRATPAAGVYLKKGSPYKPGERLVQKDLAKTLRLVAQQGFKACITGEPGKAMTRAVNATGPVWGRNDLARYEAKLREPLWGDFDGCRIATTPPPSRGGAGILRALKRYDPDPVRFAPVVRSVFRELQPVIGDPDLMPVDLSKFVEGTDAPEPGGGTTHFVIVDAEGTVVTMSQTIGHFFGSGVVAGGYGILLNDDIADTDRRPGKPNSVGPNRRSVCNMAPTMVFKDNRLRIALGTPGSLRIFPALSQVLGNALAQGMDLEHAVAAGRIHWEENRFFFEGDIDPEVRARAKRELDQPVDERQPKDLFFGGVHAAEFMDDGTIVGVADPRRGGVALPL